MSSAGPSVNPSVRSRRRRAAEPADTAVLRHPGRRPREEGSGGRVTGGYVERRDLRQTDGEAILLRSSTVPSQSVQHKWAVECYGTNASTRQSLDSVAAWQRRRRWRGQQQLACESLGESVAKVEPDPRLARGRMDRGEREGRNKREMQHRYRKSSSFSITQNELTTYQRVKVQSFEVEAESKFFNPIFIS